MSDTLDTVWDAEPHTLAKLEILKNYLGAWMPIMANAGGRDDVRNHEILYVDGFAGPGKYKGGEDGSPILALNTALNHPRQFPRPIHFIFIELDSKRCDVLKARVADLRERIDASFKVKVDEPIQGDCKTVLADILDGHERQGIKFGPALVFLDQFGYSAVPMQLIARIMKYPRCEVFSYLEARRLNQFMEDQNKRESIDAAFGGAEWQEAISAPVGERSKKLLHVYKDGLRVRGNVKYVSHFSMHNARGELIYWLFFCTNNIRGLEEMKEAMWRVDRTGTFRFSDAENPDQTSMFLNDAYTDKWLADALWSQFFDRTISGTEFKEWVLTETPCVAYKSAFKILQTEGRIVCLPTISNRGSGFDEQAKISFVQPVQSSLF